MPVQGVRLTCSPPQGASGTQAPSILPLCLPLVLGVLSIQLSGGGSAGTTSGRFLWARPGISPRHFCSLSTGQEVVTWPHLIGRKAGKCGPTASLGGRGEPGSWRAPTVPDRVPAQAVCAPSPALSTLLSRFLSLSASTNPLCRPFSPAIFAH